MPNRLGLKLKALARKRSKNLGRIRELAAAWRDLARYDGPEALQLLVEWTRERLRFAGVDGAVFGCSGGVDSSLTACVLARAAPGRVTGYLLPCESSAKDEVDARALLAALQIECRRIDVGPALRAIEPLLSGTSKASNARGNLKTRLRTMFLFHEAAARKALFVGTGDLDEGFVGYYTKGSGADLAPIASLHKSEVRTLLELALAPIDRKLARRLSRKPADAGLVPGMLAEKELGVSYSEIERSLDVILETCALFEGGVVPREIDLFGEALARSKVSSKAFSRVVELIYRARHKASGPPILWRRDTTRSGLDEFENE